MPFIPLSDVGAEPSPPRSGFVPLDEVAGEQRPSERRGFIPLEAANAEPKQPSLLKTLALENPGTAAVEAAANFGSQALALPVAGVAGLGTAAGKALGLTDQEPGDTVRNVEDALTYRPRGEMGRKAAEIVAYPFQKLAEAGGYAGGKALEATGSPALATAVDTAIQAAPMAISPIRKGAHVVRDRVRGPAEAPRATEPAPAEAASAQAASAREGFIPLQEARDAATAGEARVASLARDDQALHADEAQRLAEVRGSGDQGVPAMDGELPAVPEGHGAGTDAAALARQAERQGELPAGELRLDRSASSAAATDVLSARERLGADGDRGGSGARGGNGQSDVATAPREGVAAGDAGEALPGVDVADIPGRDATASGLGGANRDAGAGAVDADQAGMVSRSGVDVAETARAASPRYALIEADDIKAERDLTEGARTADYRQQLRENAERYGLDTAEIDAMRHPVLVRLPEESAPPRVADGGQMQDMPGRVQNSFAPGANYAPFIDDRAAPASATKTVADLPAPKRREAIIGELRKALDTTVYEGRVKGQKRLGFFRPGVDEVRIKRANDIETTAHEIAHLIDRRVPAIKDAWRSDKALREELKSVSYDRKSASEGFAEGVRLFLTQPNVLEAKAPKVYAWLESFTREHEYGPALRKAQEQMTGWFAQDALNRARSKIGSETPIAEHFDRFWDKFRQATVDDLHGIYQFERSMRGGKLEPNGPYESARLARASASIADGAIRYGYPVKTPDGSFKYAGKGLEEILKPVADGLDDALLYFVGRSARELAQQGREHLFTPGEIDAMLRLRTPERDKAFAEYQAWNRGILDFAEAQGVINPETRRLWQRTQYLPFHRVDQHGGLKGKPGDWAGIQALTGGTTNIKDVLGNMIANAAMLLDKAVKNEARLKVAKLAQTDGAGKFMVKIDAESRPVKISGDQVLEAMLQRYGISIDGPAPAFFQFLIKGQPPAGSNVVAVLQRGKPIWYEVGDPILYRALAAIDRPIQNEVVKWLGLPKRIGQATITAVPDFWIANMARDTIMGGVMSRAGFRPILDSLEGMRIRMARDQTYRDWVANGGGLSSIYLDEAKFRTKLEKFYTRQGIDYRTVIDTPGKLLNMVETLGDAFESSTRLGEYKRAVERGENPRHAAYLARDVSTDFAMKGDSKALGFMYDTVMFLRPAMVSWDRLYRGLAHDPNKGAIAAKAGLIALASAGLYLLNRNDPRYADLADWDRDANWHFFIGDQHFRWPKIWEIGALASAAERTVERILERDPLGLAKDFTRILSNTFSVNLIPQIIAPLAEQALNRNSFTKAPIETAGMEDLQPFLRAKPGTSETLKAAGMATRDLPEALQVNPVRAEALLRGYFNTFALYGLMLSDKAFFADNGPAMRADQLPVIRRFYAQEPARHTRYETEFYDLLEEAKRLRGTMRELDEMGQRELADTKEQSPMAGEAKPLERAARNLRAINKDAEQVRRDQTLTPGEKRQRLDTLTVERNDLLKAAVIDSKSAQRFSGKPSTSADRARNGVR